MEECVFSVCFPCEPAKDVGKGAGRYVLVHKEQKERCEAMFLQFTDGMF